MKENTNQAQEEIRRLKQEKNELLAELSATNDLAEFWREKYVYRTSQAKGLYEMMKGVLTIIEQEAEE